MGAGLQQGGEPIAAIGSMRLGRQAGDPVVGVGVGPFIGMRPESQVELHATRYSLVADEAQCLQIAIPFGIGQTGCGHVVAGDAQ